jgi:tetratricopeptide (TPR) repeat protein
MGEAEQCLREALEMARRHVGEDHRLYLQTLNRLADCIRTQPGRLADAEIMLRQAVETIHRNPNGDPGTGGATYTILGNLLVAQGRPDEGTQFLRQAVVSKRDFMIDDTLDTLVDVLCRQHQRSQAIAILREEVAWTDSHPGTHALWNPRSRNNIAWEYYRLGDFAAALPLAEDALARMRRLNGEKDYREDPKDAIIETADTVASIYEALGRQTEALALFEEVLRLTKEQRSSNDPFTLSRMHRLGTAYVDAGRASDAQTLLEKTMDLRRAGLGAEHPDVAATQAELGRALLGLEKFADAEPRLREALTIQDKKTPDSWTRYHTQSLLGAALAGQRKFAEAEPLLLSGYDGLQQREETMFAWDRRFVRQALERLVLFYTDWGQPDKAAAWKQRLDELNKAPKP